MTCKDILVLDTRIEGNQQVLQTWLRKLPPIQKKYETIDGDVKIVDLEQLMFAICKKYQVRVTNIMAISGKSGETPYFSATVKLLSENRWLESIHGLTLYEMMAKVCLLLYASTRKMDKR